MSKLSSLRSRNANTTNNRLAPYVGLQDELIALADKLRATYTGSTMRGLRGIGEWCLNAREKSMMEEGLRVMAELVTPSESGSVPPACATCISPWCCGVAGECLVAKSDRQDAEKAALSSRPDTSRGEVVSQGHLPPSHVASVDSRELKTVLSNCDAKRDHNYRLGADSFTITTREYALLRTIASGQ